jgi:ABC-2 type transport system ATP-binding protein
MDAAVQSIDLTKRFGQLTALNKINLEIESGDIFGLLGPSGAGKTALVRILTTVLEPTQGTAEVVGYDIHRNANQVR